MRKDELRGMTRLELLEEAKRLELRGRSTMSKDELVDALAAATRSKPERASVRPAAEAKSAEAKPAESKSPRGGKRAPAADTASPSREREPRGRSRAEEENPPAASPAAAPVSPRAAAPEAPPAASSNMTPPSSSPSSPPVPSSESSTPRPARREAARTPSHPPAERRGPPSPAREEEDEDGQNWNSTALGRDPNYGRFLNPGSVPPRNLPPVRRGHGGPPSPVTRSLAERSELGRQRAGERSYGAREDLRRSGTARRESGYTPRYERRPVESRPEPGRGRVDDRRGDDRRGDDRPGRGPSSGRGPQDSNRGGRSPAPMSERRGGGEGRPEREAPRGQDRRGPGAPPRQMRGGPAGIDDARGRGPRDIESPVIEAPRQRGDSGEDLRQGLGAAAAERRPRPPEPVVPIPRVLDRCRLMVRDPYCVHAYWEVTEEGVERMATELAGEFEGSRPILRVHGIPVSGDPDEPPAGFFDVDLAPDAKSVYVDVPRANRGYRVDVGMLTARGLFFPLASSNTVITPRDTTSRDATETWARPTEVDGAAEPEAPASGGGTTPESPSANDPSASEPAGGPDARGRTAGAGSRGGVGGRSIPAVEGTSEPAAAVATTEIRGPAGESGVGFAPETELVAGSGRGLAPAGPGIPPGVAGQEGISSKSGPGPSEPRPFRFEIHTELVVYGASEPDAKVTMQGTPVALRPDGTFSLRLQLPDGEQVLRAVARSSDGRAERVIVPVVTRRTIEEETTPDQA